ncbi:hypothetical protein CRG98_018135 [Punica granatum]|uniref:tRNA/rRNA methyltransferase SpoU type domain-containing protein n=1 Tax=Punica granatum TaxID=22663 RepID=A0A2I0JYY1_PUNGR|nr:hypothetical protein CRG98_018135 [Punica granatum]
MNKLSGVESSESTEAAAVMRIPRTFHSIVDEQKDYEFRRWFPSLHRILVLDGIQDPGNLGTLLRSAVAFNWGGVFLLPGCCDPFNDKALRASRGASFQLPIVSGYWTHLVSLKIEFGMRPLCLVLGSEGRGLSEKSESECELVSIPMTGKFESLNVSVAGGIFMFVLQPRSCRNNLK